MKKILAVATMMAALATGLPAMADQYAEQTARTLCAGCHGPNGISTNPMSPNLAGQKAEYAALQLQAYRDGKRSDPNMNGISQPLTDEQIKSLAEYYSKLPGGG